MEPTLYQFVFSAIICLLASFVQGASGFGSALVAMPLLLLIMPARMATPLCVLMGVIITTDLTLRMRKHVDVKSMLLLSAGAAPGIFAGIYLLGHLDDSFMRRLLGVVLATYSGWAMFVKVPVLRLNRWWGAAAGFTAGALGAALSTGGPPVIIYCSLLGWNRDRIKATLSAFFLAASIVIVSAHIVAGFTTEAVLKLFAMCAVPVFVGTRAGSLIYNRISERGYLRLLLSLLFAAGLLLVIS